VPSAKTPSVAAGGLTTSFFLRRPASALGKIFAECSTNGPRQRSFCRREFSQGLFAEGSPRQSLCRGQPSAKPLPKAAGPRQRSSLQYIYIYIYMEILFTHTHHPDCFAAGPKTLQFYSTTIFQSLCKKHFAFWGRGYHCSLKSFITSYLL